MADPQGTTAGEAAGAGAGHTVANSVAAYYPVVSAAAELIQADSAAAPTGPTVGYELPELTSSVKEFFAPSGMRLPPLAEYRNRHLRLLDLTGNPRTRTAKTSASLVIAARAVEHIRRTGQRVLLVTPTSANKGTALRDAVLRAVEHKLVSPSDLAVTTVLPRRSADKLWSSPLATDPELLRRNPVLLYDGHDPAAMKVQVQEFVRTASDRFAAEHGIRLWYTLDLDNYRMADTVRACVEADLFPPAAGRVRVHAHAVSSGYGLLGYHLGRRVLTELQHRQIGAAPHFLLVQHLATPDMVLSLHQGGFERGAPRYRLDTTTGRYEQHSDPRFPAAAHAPDEEIDPTFYTRRPATSAAVNHIIERHGGGGIVVSRDECLRRYSGIRTLLATAGVTLPDDPQRLREWSLVMVLTGVLNAIDRDLVPPRADVVVHGSGSYAVGDYEPFGLARAGTVARPADLYGPLDAAARP